MAIGFLPSEEDTDASYERLNRVLSEVLEVAYHLIHRQEAIARTPTAPVTSRQRVRPSSDSSAPRLPDLVCGGPLPVRRRICSQCSPPSSPSCSAQSRTFDLPPRVSSGVVLDDDVFLDTTPRPHSLRQRRRRRRKRSKINTDPEEDSARYRQTRILHDSGDPDIERDTDSASSCDEKVSVSDSPIVSALLSPSLKGTIWTAIAIVLGWKLLANKR